MRITCIVCSRCRSSTLKQSWENHYDEEIYHYECLACGYHDMEIVVQGEKRKRNNIHTFPLLNDKDTVYWAKRIAQLGAESVAVIANIGECSEHC